MPKRSIDLLNALEPLGFSEEHFRAIHHFGETASIEAHRNYCAKTGSFTSDTNTAVRKRLEIIYGLFADGLLSKPKDPRVMKLLVELAIIEHPVVRSGSA